MPPPPKPVRKVATIVGLRGLSGRSVPTSMWVSPASPPNRWPAMPTKIAYPSPTAKLMK